VSNSLVILLGLRVLGNPGAKIGNPRALDDQGASSAPATSDSTNGANVDNTPAQPTFPIEGLSPYQNNWTIKARVTQKSDIKTWSNQKGEGKLFSVTLMDDTSEIKATAFNTVVDELFSRLEEGKVYYISKARVNFAKKKFSNLANDYELTLERHTQIEEVRTSGSDLN
jgi:replication factor A1